MSNDKYGDLATNGASPLQKRLGKYELVRPLGRGGMGEVWLARDTVADVQVALKMLPPELRHSEEAQDQLRTSYQRVHRLSHPHVCGVKDLVLQEGVGYYLVMEFFEGITLSKFRHEYLQQKGSFPLTVALRLLMPVAQALDHAHKVGLAHRDVKPGNILVSRDGKDVRVIDFQLAAEIRVTVSRYTPVQVDTSGTYPYMAPEQFLGQRANAQTDLYSLAMVLYELLAGQLPYEPQGWDQWKSLVTDERIKLPLMAGLAQPVQQALAMGLILAPAQRPASCVHFLTAVKHAAERGTSAPESPIFDPVPPPPKPGGTSGQRERKTRPTPLPEGASAGASSGQVQRSAWRTVLQQRGLIFGGGLGLLVLIIIVSISGNSGTWTSRDSGSRAGELKTMRVGDVDLTLVWCPAGTFNMGRPGATSDEAPVSVTLTKGFWLGQTELTQAQYEAVLKKNPSTFKGAKHPVETVDWNDATRYCQALTADLDRAGSLAVGWSVRLPTEAEWEYACRAGATMTYSYGDDESELSKYAWFDRTDATHEVGQKRPNPWGLLDMHGNVMEWCADWYDGKLVGGTNPVGPSQGFSRVSRGGSWISSAMNCQSACRNGFGPSARGNDLGFRVCLSSD